MQYKNINMSYFIKALIGLSSLLKGSRISPKISRVSIPSRSSSSLSPKTTGVCLSPYIGSSREICEDGYPIRECFDGYDNNCDGYIDCADSVCAGTKNPNTDVICCQKDSDCPSQNNMKEKCDSPYGTPDETPGYTYTCWWLKKCEKDEDCVSGTLCYCGVCSSTFTSAGCSREWCCNKGYEYFGSEAGQCRPAGYIFNAPDGKSYICDPILETINNSSSKNIFELIYYFFQRVIGILLTPPMIT